MYTSHSHNKVSRLILPANRLGRDFILGDLHGQYSSLWALLRKVRFSPKRDRLISVGDLIDRGPQSSKCLRLLNRRWFYNVLGNHDLAFVVNLASGRGADAWTQRFCAQIGQYGGQWYMNHDRRDLFPLAGKLNNCPHIITVGDKRPAYHVVHAAVTSFIGERAMLITNQSLKQYEQSSDPEALIMILTGERLLWEGYYSQRTKGLAPVYCGHTVVDRPKWSLGHLNLDTGAGLDDTSLDERRLTVLCHQTKEIWSVTVAHPEKIVRYFVPRMNRRQ